MKKKKPKKQDTSYAACVKKLKAEFRKWIKKGGMKNE